MSGIKKTPLPRNLNPLAAAVGATLFAGLALPAMAQDGQPRGSTAAML